MKRPEENAGLDQVAFNDLPTCEQKSIVLNNLDLIHFGNDIGTRIQVGILSEMGEDIICDYIVGDNLVEDVLHAKNDFRFLMTYILNHYNFNDIIDFIDLDYIMEKYELLYKKSFYP